MAAPALERVRTALDAALAGQGVAIAARAFVQADLDAAGWCRWQKAL